MTYSEITRRLEDLERRLEVKENALNEALKELDKLKNRQSVPGRVLKNAIAPEVYEYLFNFCYDVKTGKTCEANNEKMGRNFHNLYANIMMACGYTYAANNSKDKHYYAKALPVNDIPENEYQKFCELLQEITALMYSFKANRKTIIGGEK